MESSFLFQRNLFRRILFVPKLGKLLARLADKSLGRIERSEHPLVHPHIDVQIVFQVDQGFHFAFLHVLDDAG